MENENKEKQFEVNVGAELLSINAMLTTVLQAQAKIISRLDKTEFKDELDTLLEASSKTLQRLFQDLSSK